ncbi:hypothetical protein B4099_1966 [Heyndrickxia coagulans]|uniref:Uncharacterized protein n=1 Tax=Heyndrickxia coagulans TaxID=1398 RepID=A0A150KI98_HEYCO|nr:hypothetical protein B4099_1966 [Heyndrickxia coagulans]
MLKKAMVFYKKFLKIYFSPYVSVYKILFQKKWKSVPFVTSDVLPSIFLFYIFLFVEN